VLSVEGGRVEEGKEEGKEKRKVTRKKARKRPGQGPIKRIGIIAISSILI
jgi:hypothetical protein